MAALQENVLKYEKEFGPIEIPQMQQPDAAGRTIAPFGSGEA